MKFIITSMLFLGSLCPILSQNVTFSCSYTGTTEVITAPAFENDDLEDSYNVKGIVDRILGKYNIPSGNIIVQPSSQVNNANAAVKDGKPYILFSKYFVGTIQSKSEANWRLAGIFAHEVAHHLLFHTIGNNVSRRDLELQADKWAGAALYKLGASLQQALVCANETSLNGSATHPPRSQREAAVKTGWEEAKSQGGNGGKIDPVQPAKGDFIESTTGTSFTMKFITGNFFQMGSNDGRSHEKPIHSVRLDNFFMSKYEVTNDEFCAFLNEKGNRTEGGVTWLELGSKDDHFDIIESSGRFLVKKGRGRLPIRNVNWYAATAYCVWLSEKTSKKYRLPTEAEWEYSAKGGESYKFSGSNNIDDVAWYATNSDYSTHDVGTKKGNGFGLYDMSGNVWEWCSDWYGAYNSDSQQNPTGVTTGSYRIVRGGGWSGIDSSGCGCVERDGMTPSYRGGFIGFRVCATLQ
jgi:formylglycine-generating enzyme required for sulfatase activity